MNNSPNLLNKSQIRHIEHVKNYIGKDEKKSPCFVCSWHRRKALFVYARDLISQPEHKNHKNLRSIDLLNSYPSYYFSTNLVLMAQIH
ncbi:MAG: hypothetical protein WC341_01315 [Bacteroidales bacterium]|jgi:hypothetical protein